MRADSTAVTPAALLRTHCMLLGYTPRIHFAQAWSTSAAWLLWACCSLFVRSPITDFAAFA